MQESLFIIGPPSNDTFRTYRDAELVAGSLGTPSKMPGLSYGIPASRCITGATLVKIEGSVCSGCYALKGRYVFPNVQKAQERRFQSLRHPRWVAAMAFMIQKKKETYFRWHDSGDLQGIWHLANIVAVAQRCPDTKFWLPTREKGTVRSYLQNFGAFPQNLVVRISATMVGNEAGTEFPNTSSVVRTKDQATCPAYKQHNVCGDCRRCWDPAVRNVAYPIH